MRTSEDPEHVHQARVATRRLRSDLRTFGDLLEPGWTAGVRGELRWLGQALGQVRDADVLALRLRAQAAEELTERDLQGFTELERRLSQQRQAAYAELLEALGSDRYIDLLDALTAPPSFRAGEEEELATRARGPRSLRPPSVEEPAPRGRQARRDPTDEELHQVRIKAKRLRYSAEAAAVAVGKPARRLAKAAAHLQDVLGAHHDAVTAEGWLRESAANVEAKAGVFVAGELVNVQRREQRQLRQGWLVAWESLDSKSLRRWLR